jgi:hypothetical protein
MWRVLSIIVGIFFMAPPPGVAFNFLVMHPMYSGSHEIQLRHLSLELARRGHSITYLKYKNFVDLPPPPHPNITFIVRSLDNEDNSIPFVTAEREGRSRYFIYFIF